MMKALAFAIGMLLAVASTASAQTVRFSGGGYVIAASGCSSSSTLSKPPIFVGMFVIGSYLPAGMGANGTSGNVSYTALPQYVQPFGVNLKSTGAFPTSAFATVAETMVSVVAATHSPKARIIVTPSSFTASTPEIKAELRLQNAHGITGCNVTILLGLTRNPV